MRREGYTGEIVARAPISTVSTRKPPRKIAILPMRVLLPVQYAVIVSRSLFALQMQMAMKNTDQMPTASHHS